MAVARPAARVTASAIQTFSGGICSMYRRDPGQQTTALGKAGAARARRASACLVGARAINRRGASVLRWRSTGPASAAVG
ncbi:hypothetical protein G6F66_015566 [Rhizopus arrhizus]|uniref:Uncharacterized protein n=1 Tax=Rhizopus oryzae TaxID=64495 RepID=A0A9P6WST8_RHIOR|nr:hypothetical protein G6F66_015566 [Rhizopus arrhizus]KAG1276851.1 hypothetical protein G6F64_014766 [Rhizopus arrhizus]